MVSGRCWLAMDGIADLIPLAVGDGFLLPAGRAFRLASDLAVPPVDSSTIFPPARRWTLPALAQQAGMSRSAFAQRFTATVGTAPMAYLTRWRMLLAGDRLEMSGDPVSTIAYALGYRSESAFSTTFKRVMGCSPRQHGKRPRPTGGASDQEP